MTNLNNIPLDLRKLPQWVFSKSDKHPYNARNSRPASTTDSSTHSSFEAACQAIKDYKGKCPGFVFIEGGNIVGIDLDKVIDDKGDVEPWAQEIINNFDSYTEVSQSGHGIHIIGRGKKPTNRCRKEHVEIYDKGRYFALTGNLWQDRADLHDIQDALNSLCVETFGGTAKTTEPRPVDGLVLDPNAEPPQNKHKALMENDDYRKTFEHKKRLKSLSDYDWKLAIHTIEAGWENQEIADLIIAFRREHGKAADLAKALREDYIPRTIANARAKADESQVSASALELLTFKVTKLLQYGKDHSRFSLVVEGVGEIDMGITEDLITPKKANARLLERGLVQSNKAMDKWLDIVRDLQPLKEIASDDSREDETRAWLRDWVEHQSPFGINRITTDDDVYKIFFDAANSIAEGDEGTIYLRISDAARYSAVHSGLRGVSPKTLAPDLIKVGFKSKEFKRKEEDGHWRQVTLWISQPGFMDVGV